MFFLDKKPIFWYKLANNMAHAFMLEVGPGGGAARFEVRVGAATAAGDTSAQPW